MDVTRLIRGVVNGGDKPQHGDIKTARPSMIQIREKKTVKAMFLALK